MTASLPPVAVLAGGLGTRIRPVAGETPKVILPVEGRPFLSHLLDYLAGEGASRVVLCVGHGADEVEAAVSASAPAGLGLEFSRETAPLGTGGAVAHALDRLGDEFFIVNGDTLVRAPLPELLAVHRAADALLTLSLVRHHEASEKGAVTLDDTGAVTRFAEKERRGPGLINAGVYAARAALFSGVAPDHFCSLERELIPRALAAGERVRGQVLETDFIDIGLPDDYLRVRDRMKQEGGRG